MQILGLSVKFNLRCVLRCGKNLVIIFLFLSLLLGTNVPNDEVSLEDFMLWGVCI